MRIVPINEAEAIIEPFWDGGSSEHPTDKLNRLDPYTVIIPPRIRGDVRQIWCAVQVNFEHAAPTDGPIVIERPCDLDLAGYDILRIFASVPDWVTMRVVATFEHPHGSQAVALIDGVRGANTNDEFDGPLPSIPSDGARLRMTALRLEFALLEARPASVNLLWIGLANAAKQAAMEARRSPYTVDWPDLLRPAEQALTYAGAFEPAIGLLFDASELEALRERVRTDLLRDEYAAMRQQAERDLLLNPEADIGPYIAKPDRRWCRNRDMHKVQTAGLMERLALVGLIERDIRMSRMAARMALSAAHCDTWCESIIGVFPGATWHHRSFTEEIYARACGLVLDWAGFCLTPHAQQVIRDAIIMKALPRIESDFKRMEYIRQMNQGIVFSSGRILGALALLPAYPRYRSLVEEAERDLHEMIEAYVHDDGGTLEGMGYWSYTFSQVMPVALALARYHGQDLLEYGRENVALRKTGDYGLGMLSSVGNGTTYLPINDAHADATYPVGLVAAYVHLSGDPRWRALYRTLAEASRGPDSAAQQRSDPYHLIMAPSGHLLKDTPALHSERFDVFPNVGQVSSVRMLGREADPAANADFLVHFHMTSGPTYSGHYHEDKGSFILEAGYPPDAAIDEDPGVLPLIYDRGVTSYDHPEVNLIGMAARHNLVYPERADGSLVRQPASAQGGVLTAAHQVEGRLLLTSDNHAAWEDGLFTRNIRRVFSPTPALYLFDDDIVMPEPAALAFLINTPWEISARAASIIVQGKAAWAHITPLNWIPARIEAGVDGIDCHLHPAYLGRLVTAPTGHARLLTAIEVVRAGQDTPTWQISASGPDRVAIANRSPGGSLHTVTLEINGATGVLDIRDEHGSDSFDAHAVDGTWVFIKPSA